MTSEFTGWDMSNSTWTAWENFVAGGETKPVMRVLTTPQRKLDIIRWFLNRKNFRSILSSHEFVGIIQLMSIYNVHLWELYIFAEIPLPTTFLSNQIIKWKQTYNLYLWKYTLSDFKRNIWTWTEVRDRVPVQVKIFLLKSDKVSFFPLDIFLSFEKRRKF